MSRITKYPSIDTLTYEQKAMLVNALVESLIFASPILNESLGQVAPGAEYLRDGYLAYADGTNWDPLSNGVKGFYRYNTTTVAWVFVG